MHRTSGAYRLATSSPPDRSTRRAPGTVLLFPGQSSRRTGMLANALRLAPEATGPVLEQASDVLGRDLLAWDALPAEEAFATNRDVQVGVFVANHLHLTAWRAQGGSAERSAGMSLGEYNHLVHIGAIDFLHALALVDARGRAYDAGPSGCMAAVFPATFEELDDLLLGVDGRVAISNRNSPTQQVIAGDPDAVHTALERADDILFATGTVIERRIPMHTAWFAPVAEDLRPALEKAPWTPPRHPYLPNVLGRPVFQPTPQDIVAHLIRHVSEAVRWQDTIECLHRQDPDAVFVEVGPATVLHDLMRRSWLPVRRAHTADPDGFVKALAATDA